MQHQQYNQNYYQSQNKSNHQNQFANYIQANDYTNYQSIFEAYPHLKNINQNQQFTNNVNGIVIRSANDDNVHKAIKYGIWTTTPKNRIKLDQIYQRNQLQEPKTQTYLFFSVVKSGMFEGVAKLVSGYYQQTFPYWWQNHTLKFKGFFKIQWVYIKDVNYKHLEGYLNTQKEDVTRSKDCDMLDTQTTLSMLRIYNKRPNKRNIFMDFRFMDQRQKNYTRPLYEQTIENYYNRPVQNIQNGYQQNGYQQTGYQQNGYQQNGYQQTGYQIPANYINPTVNMQFSTGESQFVPTMMRPTQKPNTMANGNNLGFQLNPISKNKKK